MDEVLYRALARDLTGSRLSVGAHDAVEGVEHIDKIIEIDQSPIGRTPRSNPATYVGPVRTHPGAVRRHAGGRVRGYMPGRFSFNVKGGRCENCKGDGIIKIEMQFLPDVYVPCEVCKGKRYEREALEIHYKGRNDRGRPGDDRRGGAGVLRRGAQRAQQAPDAVRRGSGLRRTSDSPRPRSRAARPSG